MRLKWLGILATAAVLVAAPAGCGLFGSPPGPEDVARQFLAAFAAGDTATAAKHTDSAEAAKPMMDNVRRSLKPTAVTGTVDRMAPTNDGRIATAAFTLNWDLGRGKVWSYPSSLELRTDSGEWKVHWASAVLHPRLAAQQTIAVRVEEPRLAPVLDRDGVPLLAPDRVVSIVLDPAKAGDLPAVTGRLAAAAARFDPTITAQSVTEQAARTPGRPVQVVTLREGDYQQVKQEIYDLPGVRFTASTRLLPVEREFAPQLLPTLRRTVEDEVGGHAGWRVVTLDPVGSEVEDLYTRAAEPAQAVRATLGKRFQAAAEAAVDPLTTPAAIVAMQPSTGELLAVAQNAPADAQGPIALTGQYPPGSTFKIATAVAALRAGRVAADTPVPCPGSATIGPRAIPNSGGFDKGVIPLHSAFAFSCNTTFAQLAADLPADALTGAAEQLGLGVDFVVPGITTITGSVPAAPDLTERAEDGIGQGKVLASPFGMAVVASTVAAGTVPTPTLLRGEPTQASLRPRPVEQPVLDAVRQMMREVVTGGTGGALAGVPDVAGKTGTAQFGDGTHSHGWFVGYRGDLAFAVLVTDAGTAMPATESARAFLAALG